MKCIFVPRQKWDGVFLFKMIPGHLLGGYHHICQSGVAMKFIFGLTHLIT